jgi:outer membrane immunogenic protein
MNALVRPFFFFAAGSLLTLAAMAGPEPIAHDYKASKEVAPLPSPPCNWTGFYLGLNGGGVFGMKPTVTDVDLFNASGGADREWSYDTDGFVGGGQAGYNLQIGKWLVLGAEADVGYLGVNGSKRQPNNQLFGFDTFAETNPGVYTTWRARAGVTFNGLMIYATGGGIGADHERRIVDDCNISPCGPDLGSGSNDDFKVGWTVGGGGEWMLNRRWSFKVEYLYYDLGIDDDVFLTVHSGRDVGSRSLFHFSEDVGHIVRGGINFHF